jgi:PiT family inorganic phosphate transporter
MNFAPISKTHLPYLEYSGKHVNDFSVHQDSSDSMEVFILVFGIAAGIYMAWNIGANDVANGMASAVGAKAITLRQAVFIAGILDFIGATFIGSHVTSTIRKNIVDPSVLSDPNIVMLGLLSALLAAGLWVFFATWSQLPVSTTHSVVGAMIGFGLIAGGPSVIRWWKVFGIVFSWILSPFFASLLAYIMFQMIRNLILSKPDMFRTALKLSPFFSGLALFIVALSFLLKTPMGGRLGVTLWQGTLVSLIFCAILSGIGYIWMKRTIFQTGEEGVERIFRRLQIMTSCYVALAHGANDVANAMGPLAGIYLIFVTHALSPDVPVPSFLLALGGVGIAMGVFTWGYRVIETLGNKITTLTNTRGFSVDFGTATCVLIASKLGLPVSTTHAAVGAVVGVGLAGGISAVDFRMVWKICLYWVITLPLAALSCMIIFKILTALLY